MPNASPLLPRMLVQYNCLQNSLSAHMFDVLWSKPHHHHQEVFSSETQRMKQASSGNESVPSFSLSLSVFTPRVPLWLFKRTNQQRDSLVQWGWGPVVGCSLSMHGAMNLIPSMEKKCGLTPHSPVALWGWFKKQNQGLSALTLVTTSSIITPTISQKPTFPAPSLKEPKVN